MSPDTIVPTSTQGTQAWDRYAYVNNSPLKFIDATGHDGIPFGVWNSISSNISVQALNYPSQSILSAILSGAISGALGGSEGGLAGGIIGGVVGAIAGYAAEQVITQTRTDLEAVSTLMDAVGDSNSTEIGVGGDGECSCSDFYFQTTVYEMHDPRTGDITGYTEGYTTAYANIDGEWIPYTITSSEAMNIIRQQFYNADQVFPDVIIYEYESEPDPDTMY